MRHVLMILLLVCLPLPALAVSAPEPYLRYQATPPGHDRLESAVVQFRRGPVTVDLVAAVHVADKGYYRTLQKRLNAYQKLLFELVADDGQRVVRSGVRTDSSLSGVQLWMRDKLALSFQLEEIDYRRPNFVHADLGPDALAAHLRSHWVDTLGMLLRWMIRDMSRTLNADGSANLGGLEHVVGGQTGDAHLLLKRMLAHELAELGDLTGGGQGADALIARRNEAALAVLRAELGKGVKRVGIFYGGAHMPDLERKLVALGFARTTTTWLTAWDLRDRTQPR